MPRPDAQAAAAAAAAAMDAAPSRVSDSLAARVPTGRTGRGCVWPSGSASLADPGSSTLSQDRYSAAHLSEPGGPGSGGA
jgi:hypothetical protein